MLSLVRRVYTAAADETQWPLVLESLADEYGGGVAGFLYRTGLEGRTRSARLVRLEPELQTALRTHYADRNPWVRVTQRLYQPGFAYALDSLIPIPELRRTEFYDGILMRAGVIHCVGACVFRRGDDVLSFTVVRQASRGPFTPAELTRVQAMLPHLDRAVQVNERLATLQGAHAGLLDGLERLGQGVAIVNRSGRVVYANRSARAIASQEDGLSFSADSLVASSRADRVALRSLLGQALRTSSGEGTGSGGVITISRPSMKRPFVVVAAPLTLASDVGIPAGGATVFIRDPETPGQTADDVLRRLYGLTQAEARVAKAFADTGSVSGTGERLRITRDTVRWHLKRIFHKTGSRGQAALIRRLASDSLQMVPANTPSDGQPQLRFP